MLPMYWVVAGLSALAGGSLEALRSLPSRKRKASEMNDRGVSPPLTHESESAPAGPPPQDGIDMCEHTDIIACPGVPEAIMEAVPVAPAPSAAPSAGQVPSRAAGLPPSPAPSCSAGAGAASPADGMTAAPEAEAAPMHAAPSLPASPAHSSLTPRSAGAPAASNHAGPAASGGACAAEAAGALIVLAAPPTAPSDLQATPHLPHARTTAPLTSPTPAALPSGSGSGVHASGSQPGPSRGQALSNRAQRELKGLQSFGWDRQKYKHPVNDKSPKGQINQIIRRLEQEGIDGDMAGSSGGAAGAEGGSADPAPRRASKRLKTEPEGEPDHSERKEEPDGSPCHTCSPSGHDTDYDSDPDILDMWELS